jgi:transposase
LKNLSEAVLKLFQSNYTLIKQQLHPEKDAQPENPAENLVSTLEQGNGSTALTPAEERRKARIEEVQQLHQSGWTQKNIAAQLNLNRKTVRRYLRSPNPKSGRSGHHRLTDSYRSYLINRWNEGHRNATQLFLEIHARGYQGKATTVRNFVKPFRQDKGPVKDPDRSRSLREITWYVLRKPADRKTEHEETLEQIKNGQPQLETTIHLARSFAAIIRERDSSEFKRWLKQAEESGLPVWRNFANSLKQDEDAVCAALIHPWSNGPTEGHINRLKFIKRMMYGRGKLDLLRKRVLWQGRWGFT